MKLPIYLDHHATTPIDERVFHAMEPFLREDFGNPASNHVYGWKVKKSVDQARQYVADLIGAASSEIYFTSGATEANNLAIQGALQRLRQETGRIITQATEHPAVLDVFKDLSKKGWDVQILPVDTKGQIDLPQLESLINDETVLISIMHANNEIGSILPIEVIGQMAKKHQILFHVDAAQSLGKIEVDVDRMGIDLLSASAHKLYGPKGVGFLYMRHKNPHVKLKSLYWGGGQEQGVRPGTLNIPGIVGLGEACCIARVEWEKDFQHTSVLRDYLKSELLSRLEDVCINGGMERRLPNNLNVSFLGVESESLIMGINEEIALSSGSACATGQTLASHVLSALQIKGEQLHTAIRFGLGRLNTREEIDYTLEKVCQTVKKLRKVSPLYLSNKN